MNEFDSEILPKGPGTPFDRDDMVTRPNIEEKGLGGFSDKRHSDREINDPANEGKYLAG